MNRLAPAVALLVGLPMLAAAQSGTIKYDQSTRLDFDVPRDSPFFANLPTARVKPMVLTYNSAATLFVAGPDTGRRGPGGREALMVGDVAAVRIGGGGGGRGAVMVTEGGMMGGRAMTMGFRGARGQQEAASSYTDLAASETTEVHEFLGRKFRIAESRPSYPWKLTGQQAMFLGYPVMQAVAQQDSTEIEAWFTPDIPVSGGPGAYGGLPGMILMLAVDTNRVVYTATAIDTVTAVGALEVPTDGNKVTRAEFDKTVAEKMAEMNQGRRGRRN